jgi:hypothetical protein
LRGVLGDPIPVDGTHERTGRMPSEDAFWRGAT